MHDILCRYINIERQIEAISLMFVAEFKPNAFILSTYIDRQLTASTYSSNRNILVSQIEVEAFATSHPLMPNGKVNIVRQQRLRQSSKSSSLCKHCLAKMTRKSRRLLHPRGFFASLWPYRCTCMLFSHCNSASKISRLVYGACIIFVHLILSYFVSYGLYKSVTEQPGFHAEVFVANFTFWSQPIIVTIHALTWAFVGNACYKEVVSSSTLVDRELVRICSKHVDLKMMVIRQLVCLALSVSFPAIRALLHILGRPDGISWWNVAEIGVIHYPGIVTNVVMSFYGNLAYLTGDRYALINSALRGIGKVEKNHAKAVKLEEAALIRQLRIVHQKLFFVSRNIAKAFAVQTVACVFSALVNTVYDLYILYAIQASPCEGWDSYDTYHSVIGIACDLAVVVYVAYCCHRTVREANRTTKILNSFTTTSEASRMEISSFSHQLMHCQPHFSALGFFNLDLSLLQSMAGSMATYLIILVQMESDECGKNGTTVVYLK